ncbi:hypothetical protein QAD02_013374 [Eretmocerus hayati]|uniref:Uncharacterized protein n=1 Tax=Eretmocerus hayati TaxID=131215 RepID=A0ACC2P2H8_9HYME|nr:hypothetical protein QAD02_013374 [Eretmocerus hayati]
MHSPRGENLQNEKNDTCKAIRLRGAMLSSLFDRTAPRFRGTNLVKLTDLIEAHNEVYIELYEYLKSKGHFGVHLTRVVRNSGPPIHYWCVKFKRKHDVLKRIAIDTTSSVNLLFTMAISC